MTLDKIYYSVIGGMQDSNIKFRDLQRLLEALGFHVRIKGDHFIYFHDGMPEILNIQPIGNMAKPYQVKQIRNILVKYGMEV